MRPFLIDGTSTSILIPCQSAAAAAVVVVVVVVVVVAPID